jgi:hypothetical protein
MLELCWESIMIYGTPTREFAHLARDYKCHYIYPHEWDDDIASMSGFCNIDVYHHDNMVKAGSNAVGNSMNMVMSDEGHRLLLGGVLIVYLPSYQGHTIHRNEHDIYLAIGLPEGIVRPYNSIEYKEQQPGGGRREEEEDVHRGHTLDWADPQQHHDRCHRYLRHPGKGTALWVGGRHPPLGRWHGEVVGPCLKKCGGTTRT